MITAASRTVRIICADPALAHRYLRELEHGNGLYEIVLAPSPAEAQRNGGQVGSVVTLLDESAVAAGESLAPLAALLCNTGPVVVVASPERLAGLDALIASRSLDLVPRSGEFVPVAAGLLERHISWGEFGQETISGEWETVEGFGELLRHEMNNPLTGILGNAEMLLARRDALPPDAVERLETIAELAVRLRETVRRLSHTWQERRDQVPST